MPKRKEKPTVQRLSHECGPLVLKEWREAVKGEGMRASGMGNGVQQDYLLQTCVSSPSLSWKKTRTDGGFLSKQVIMLDYFL